MSPQDRIPLAHLPTPLWHHPALDELLGCEVWVKRDDMTGGAESGNKLRKLETLLFEARRQGARCVITCGGAQSNHARATAICARRVGMRALLFLRSPNGTAPPLAGNLFLDRVAGAEIRWITPEQYRDREPLMASALQQCAEREERAFIIPEGGSNGLGALGYAYAAAEIRQQLDLGIARIKDAFGWVVCACGSGGTAAGLALGAKRHSIAHEVRAIAVCDSREHFETVTHNIMQQARTLDELLDDPAPLVIEDGFIGPGYGVMSDEQKAFLLNVAQRTGLILDPVYSGKALFGLSRLSEKPPRVLFVHTGGLPGLLAQAAEFEPHLVPHPSPA